MKPDTYIFTSNISGLKVPIKLLPEDIVINGELRRAVREDNGEIPEWAQPTSNLPDYMRVTIDGKVYNRKGQLIEPNDRRKDGVSSYIMYEYHGGRAIRRSLTHLILNSFGVDDVSYLCINGEYDKIQNKIHSYGYRLRTKGNIQSKDIHSKWSHMLYRCNPEITRECDRAYAGVSVTGLFPVYEYFEKWFLDNTYRIKSDAGIQIDKDILIKNNKEYNANSVLIVPDYINLYFSKMYYEHSGSVTSNGTYRVYCKPFMSSGKGDLGCFATQEDARAAWALFKTEQLHNVVLPYFVNDVVPEDINKPMVQLIINTLKNYEFT